MTSKLPVSDDSSTRTFVRGMLEQDGIEGPFLLSCGNAFGGDAMSTCVEGCGSATACMPRAFRGTAQSIRPLCQPVGAHPEASDEAIIAFLTFLDMLEKDGRPLRRIAVEIEVLCFERCQVPVPRGKAWFTRVRELNRSLIKNRDASMTIEVHNADDGVSTLRVYYAVGEGVAEAFELSVDAILDLPGYDLQERVRVLARVAGIQEYSRAKWEARNTGNAPALMNVLLLQPIRGRSKRGEGKLGPDDVKPRRVPRLEMAGLRTRGDWRAWMQLFNTLHRRMLERDRRRFRSDG